MDLLDDDRLLNLRRRATRTDPAAVIAEERRQNATSPRANDALEQWQTARQSDATPGAAATSPSRVMCPLCNVRPGRQTCNACQRVVCPADIWTMLGLCKGCASAEDVAHWHKPAAPETENWLGGRK